MTKPTPADLVKAVGEAQSIVTDAIPVDQQAGDGQRQELLTLRAAALPVILRELLDVEVTWGPSQIDTARRQPQEFNPDWTVAPAALLADWMREHHTTLPGLAARCGAADPGQAEAMLQDVLDRRELTAAHAALIAAGTGTPARSWSGLEAQYRADLAAGRKDTTGDLRLDATEPS